MGSKNRVSVAPGPERLGRGTPPAKQGESAEWRHRTPETHPGERERIQAAREEQCASDEEDPGDAGTRPRCLRGMSTQKEQRQTMEHLVSRGGLEDLEHLRRERTAQRVCAERACGDGEA